MKFKIDDINNLSDSRQVMESKPNKFIIVFIYILLLLILTFFTWAWFSEKEIVVKASGIVRPNSEIQAVSNIIQGEVKSVKMKDGESVSKGDILFEIDSTDLEREKKQIDEQIGKINIHNQNETELEIKKKQIKQSLEKCIVRSPVNGKVNTVVNLQQGLVLQTGAIVANIIPNSCDYKVDLMIATKDIANINVNKEIKYSFESLPSMEYGFLNGRVESISPDSKLNSKTDMSFFTGEGSLNSNVLYSNKREKGYIRPGMLCEAKIIIKNEKMLYYILEQVGLKNK